MPRLLPLKSRLILLLLSCLIFGLVSGADAVKPYESYGTLPATYSPPEDASLCVIVRTYWGHARHRTKFGLRELLRSLQSQTHKNWEALLVVLDAKPFADLAHIVEEVSDSRVWVFAERINYQYLPKAENGYWAAQYHAYLYNLTDEAIRACPGKTRWVLVTNGDNEYASTTFETVAKAVTSDVVAFDFYSRYQRVTGPRCERFSRQQGLPPCKVNMMQWCHTDLGANALSWPRLIHENRRFGDLPTDLLGSDNLDGVMAQALVEADWQVVHLAGMCLFEHDPSPQRCAQGGGVWDDTLATALGSPGGACIDAEEALTQLAKEGIEEQIIQLSHDERLGQFPSAGGRATLHIRCLRDAEPEASVEYAAKFFGAACAAEYDASMEASSAVAAGKLLF